MKSTAAWIESGSTGLKPGARAKLELTVLLGTELRRRAPGCAHHRLSEDFLRALWEDQTGHEARLRKAILKQEVWRLLVTMRMSGKASSEARAEFEQIALGLTERMGKVDEGPEAVREIDRRLREALGDLRDWPLS